MTQLFSIIRAVNRSIVQIALAVALFCLPVTIGVAIEVQPWFGDVLEFHFLQSYSYSWFHSVQNSRPAYRNFFQTNLIYSGLEFSPSPIWDIDIDLQFVDTTKTNFNFQTMAFQTRYLWLDDIIGDPISFATGASIRLTATSSLRDVSCPSHGNLDFEINVSLGKEFDASDRYRFRAWMFGSVGHANRGAPWVRAIGSIEMNCEDIHKWAIYATGINGYGRHTHVNVDHFFGYAKIREKTIDLGIRYGYGIGVWGTLRIDFLHRVLAKAAPRNVNNFIVSWLLPFSF